MRFLFSLLLLWIFILPAHAEQVVLQGSVTKTWSLEDARTEAFKDAVMSRNLNSYSAQDSHLISNTLALQAGLKEAGNQVLSSFGNGWYATRQKGSNEVLYYRPNGQLDSLEVEIKTGDYPIKTYLYQYPSGKLQRVGLDVNKDESFLFTTKKELSAHWIGNNGYDTKGKLFTTRTGHDPK